MPPSNVPARVTEIGFLDLCDGLRAGMDHIATLLSNHCNVSTRLWHQSRWTMKPDSRWQARFANLARLPHAFAAVGLAEAQGWAN